MQCESAPSKVVKPRAARVVLCPRPVESMGISPRILASLVTPAAPNCPESGGAAGHQRTISRFAPVRRFRAHPSVTLRQLSPFLFRRQSPSASQCLTSLPRGFPRVQPPIPAAICFSVFIAPGRRCFQLQVVSRPLFPVRHPLRGSRPAGNLLRHRTRHRAAFRPHAGTKRDCRDPNRNRPSLFHPASLSYSRSRVKRDLPPSLI